MFEDGTSESGGKYERSKSLEVVISKDGREGKEGISRFCASFASIRRQIREGVSMDAIAACIDSVARYSALIIQQNQHTETNCHYDHMTARLLF